MISDLIISSIIGIGLFLIIIISIIILAQLDLDWKSILTFLNNQDKFFSSSVNYFPVIIDFSLSDILIYENGLFPLLVLLNASLIFKYWSFFSIFFC